ncbi:MAG: hypothetical protein QM662_05755 [Gordonia sp. (in: high G+C Gram-positive bacteria)]
MRTAGPGDPAPVDILRSRTIGYLTQVNISEFSRLLGGAALLSATALVVAACSAEQPSAAPGTSSFPTSVSVAVPEGTPEPTAPGTTLRFGESAVLPANAFRLDGPTALYTVTGITKGEGIRKEAMHDGQAYFVYLTVTALSARPTAAPGVVGFAGSVDGHTPLLTTPPPGGLRACVKADPQERMKRGESYATCLVAYADPDQEPTQVIFWANTGGETSTNFEASPVAWTSPAPAGSGAPSSAPVSEPAG